MADHILATGAGSLSFTCSCAGMQNGDFAIYYETIAQVYGNFGRSNSDFRKSIAIVRFHLVNGHSWHSICIKYVGTSDLCSTSQAHDIPHDSQETQLRNCNLETNVDHAIYRNKHISAKHASATS